MKKVGILTMHTVRNYGSFLQAYATQKSVEVMGYEAMLIDYQYPNALHAAGKSKKSQLLHTANTLVKTVLPGNPNRRLNQRWQEAYDSCYRLSKRYPDRESLRCDPPDCDILMIGSDQVWNERFIRGDDTFFGAFAPPEVRRIAFASSFGSLSVADRSFYRKQLAPFSSIAVREASGAALVRELTGRTDVNRVCDPTILLPTEHWQSLARPQFAPEKPYVLCYGSNHREYLLQTAKEIAAPRGWEVCCCNGTALDSMKSDRRTFLDVGPFEWLWLIQNAALVMACSFHGTVFSILFETPFLAVYTGNASFDSRIDNILSAFRLQNCRVEAGQTVPAQMDAVFSPGWQDVRELVAAERRRSSEILAQSLNGSQASEIEQQ